jgi:hypothetical protein
MRTDYQARISDIHPQVRNHLKGLVNIGDIGGIDQHRLIGYKHKMIGI